MYMEHSRVLLRFSFLFFRNALNLADRQNPLPLFESYCFPNYSPSVPLTHAVFHQKGAPIVILSSLPLTHLFLRSCVIVNMATLGLYPALACFMGLTGVGLGAFGAHGLRARGVKADSIQSWSTGVHYQLLHAVTMLGVALYQNTLKNAAAAAANPNAVATTAASLPFRNAMRCWLAGTLMFSGSIYVLVLGGPRFPFGPMTPVGGVVIMIGWGLAMFGK